MSFQRWSAAAVVGVLVALATEFATLRSLGHRTAHALGFGLGVGAFNLARARLRPPAGRPPLRRAVAESALLGLAILVANWFVGGLMGR